MLRNKLFTSLHNIWSKMLLLEITVSQQAEVKSSMNQNIEAHSFVAHYWAVLACHI